jgi:hypothetical protein
MTRGVSGAAAAVFLKGHVESKAGDVLRPEGDVELQADGV